MMTRNQSGTREEGKPVESKENENMLIGARVARRNLNNLAQDSCLKIEKRKLFKD